MEGFSIKLFVLSRCSTKTHNNQRLMKLRCLASQWTILAHCACVNTITWLTSGVRLAIIASLKTHIYWTYVRPRPAKQTFDVFSTPSQRGFSRTPRFHVSLVYKLIIIHTHNLLSEGSPCKFTASYALAKHCLLEGLSFVFIEKTNEISLPDDTTLSGNKKALYKYRLMKIT
jgi:hypothetical protein